MTTEAELLDAVYAAPDDDAPRQVYADWLIERSDPRGELIALQLAATRTTQAEARIRSLVKRHRRSWLGLVWDAVYRVPIFGGDALYDLRFARGFLDEAATNFRSNVRVPSIGDPRWSTLRTLCASDSVVHPDGTLWNQALALYTHDVLRPLHHLTNTHADTAIALLEDPRPRRLEIFGVNGDPNHATGARLRAALTSGGGLPQLRVLKLLCLDVPAPSRYEWLFATALGARLDTLVLSRRPVEHAPWLAACWLPASLRAIHFVEGATVLALDRDDYGTWRTDGRLRQVAGPPDR